MRRMLLEIILRSTRGSSLLRHCHGLIHSNLLRKFAGIKPTCAVLGDHTVAARQLRLTQNLPGPHGSAVWMKENCSRRIKKCKFRGAVVDTLFVLIINGKTLLRDFCGIKQVLSQW